MTHIIYVELYEILGIDAQATPDAIKKAYRSKAQQAHPDKGGDPEEFRAIQEAYDVLSDVERRARYDSDGTYRHEARPSEEDKANALAQNGLMQVLAQVIDNTEHVEYTDIFETLGLEANRILGEMNTQREAMAKRLAKLEKAVKRIKPKDGKDNIASLLMQNVVNEVTDQISNADFSVKVAQRMIEIIGGHEYEVDDEPEDLEQARNEANAKSLEDLIRKQFAYRFGSF